MFPWFKNDYYVLNILQNWSIFHYIFVHLFKDHFLYRYVCILYQFLLIGRLTNVFTRPRNLDISKLKWVFFVVVAVRSLRSWDLEHWSFVRLTLLLCNNNNNNNNTFNEGERILILPLLAGSGLMLSCFENFRTDDGLKMPRLHATVVSCWLISIRFGGAQTRGTEQLRWLTAACHVIHPRHVTCCQLPDEDFVIRSQRRVVCSTFI